MLKDDAIEDLSGQRQQSIASSAVAVSRVSFLWQVIIPFFQLSVISFLSHVSGGCAGECIVFAIPLHSACLHVCLAILQFVGGIFDLW